MIEPLLVSDYPKKIGTSDAFYVTIRHVFDYTFLTKNIKECSLQIYSIATEYSSVVLSPDVIKLSDVDTIEIIKE